MKYLQEIYKTLNVREVDLSRQYVRENLSLFLKINILMKKSRVLELIGKWNEAEKENINCLEYANVLKDEHTIAQCKIFCAQLFAERGKYDRALKLFKEALKREKER